MNKFRFALLFLFCSFQSTTYAQKFSIGLKVGALGSFTNFADKSTRDTLRSSIKPGFSVGGLINFPLKNKYSFQAEGGFSQQGRAWTYKPDNSQFTSTYYFADMSMALRKNFQLKLFKNIPSEWFFNVGPNINYWIGGKGRYEPHQGTGSPPTIVQNFLVVFDDTKQITGGHVNKLYVNGENRWLYGINIGLGFNVTTLRNQKIVTELRMTWGQTYLGQSNSEHLGSDPLANAKMNLKCNLKVLNFSIGYVLDRDIQKGRLGKSTKKIK